NRSPGELQPVFDILLEKAMQLCGAAFGVLAVLEGEQTHTVAARGLPPALAEWRRTHSVISPRNTLLARVLEGEPYVHSLDLKDDHLYRQGEPLRRANVDLGGARSSLYVPLLRGCDVLGTVHLYRQEVRPFTDQQIALLQNIAAQAVIAMENARLLTETREALDQQTATAEVLGVINSSPGDLAPVFEAALDKALDLCGAAFGTLWICEGDLFRAAALRRVPKPYAEFLARQPIRPAAGSSVLGQLFAGNAFAHVLDVASDAAYQNDSAAARSLIQLGGFRTVAGVPLRKDGKLLGAITIYRREVRAFTDKQIALLQNFAAQAVIAMENARLLGETREALEQQTATAEVLQVINSSPGDLAPVFDAMLEKALRLCEAAFGNLWTYDGEASRLAAIHGASPEYRAELLRAGPQKPEPGGALIRLVEGEPLVHIADITSGAAYRSGNAARRRMADRSGARTVLWVPMRKEGVLLGFFAIYRTEVRPFTDKQIALLQNFAAQAVIAMENARLITETRKALEQQTATAEVLGVINSSPGDLAPVFDTMVDTAARLCGTNMAGLAIRVGDAYRYVATRSLNPEWDSCVRSSSFKPERGTATGRTLLERRIIHVADLAADPEQTVPEIVSVGGIRTFLGVPLLREGEPIGVLALARQHVEPFSEQQIALVGTFAAQAVIAMENARLLAETREALEQQTATAEVLGVINSSPGDLSPVFEAMLEKAMRLCAAAFGYLMTYDGERFHPVAQRGLPPPFADYLAGMDQPGPSGAYARVRAGTPLVHIADLMEGEVYRTSPLRRALVDLGGARTGIVIALRKEDTLLGVFTIYRQEVRPFTEKQIALLENFAAQAVIAIENARLLTETREALEQQTATAEVLQVINSSPGDLGPVFDAMLQKAMRLCDAAFGSFLTFDGERFLAVVHRGVPAELMESLRQPQSATPGGSFARLVRGEPIVHLADIADDDGYRRGLRGRVAMVDIGGARTAVWVALRKDEALLGALVLYRQQVRPFSDKQIALLENFAAQAVIAIENARLLGELRLRTDDLQESLEYQTATSEVLKVISRAGAALEPVLQTLTETAARMCQADRAALNQLADGAFRTTAVFGFSQEFRDHRARIPILADRSTVTGRMAVERRVIHIEDVWTDPELTAPGRTQTWRLGQFRTALAVPLLRDDAVIGGFFLARLRVEPFTDRQIELVQTFADQAVIAIENARLITETREALERQTATAEILEVINRSPGDLGPVFEAILDRAHRLCGASNGTLFL
ncbi:MAG TPA: GAF domain-containing protein, partial [Burkholderiales bacterium]